MAYRVSNGAGTAFNTAANWDEGVNAPTVHASTSITVPNAGTNIFSATFTAPNTTNACTGVLVKVAAVGSVGTITAQLQESSVDVAGASVTINITAMRANSHVFFKFTTPYVFTSTAVGRYRIRISSSGASGTTSLAADSGGANFSYLATMDSNVVPTTGDDFFVAPSNATTLTIDLDADATVGSGTNTSTGVFRSWGNAFTICNGGVLAWPTATNRTLTHKGNPVVDPGGEWRMGTTASPVEVGVLARSCFDQNGVTTNYGLSHVSGAKISFQGESLTFKKTTLSSGVGTAASPAVFADSVDWNVGDELVFVPVSNNAANYDETETRFIITKNSATSYVLSATSGGSEAAFTYSHADGTVFNLTRPVLIDTTDTTKAWYADFNETSDVTNVDLDGCRLETTGSGVAGRTTLTFSNLATEMFTADDVVFYRQVGTSGILFGNNNDQRTYTWLIFYDCNATGNMGALFLSSMRNKRFENCHVIDSLSRGFFLGSSSSLVFDSCGAWACGRTTTADGGWGFQNSSNVEMYSCDVHANRGVGLEMATMPKLYAFECQIGNKGYNQANDIVPTTDNYSTALFENCLVGSTTVISNYTNAAPGTEVAFQKYNQTANDHRWYTKYGHARSTGASLADTNVRTSGSLAVRIAPESTSPGFDWQFKILARANSAVGITGFIQKNAAFGSDVATVELYLPGLVPGVDTPSDTMNMPNDTTFDVFNLAANYSGTVDLFATVRIVAKSATASAYIYIDDLYNGTNPLTALDVWEAGKPVELIYPELGDPGSVWAVLASTLTTSGTIGYFVTKLLTVAKFIGLR